jgi:hypothetical protein
VIIADARDLAGDFIGFVPGGGRCRILDEARG